jgi:hypothetical protein
MSVAASRRGAVASVCVFALWLAVAGTARGQGIPDSPATEAPAQASGQEATTGQAATTSAEAEDAAPTNIFVSVRVDSPGDNGPVTQTSTTAVAGDAANDAATGQDAWQHWDSGDQAARGQPQSSAQDSDTSQAAATTATATRAKPTNVVVSVRVNSPGDDGPVTQSSTVVVGAESTNTAATAQKAQQAQTGPQDVAATPAAPAEPAPTAAPKPAPGAVAERPAASSPPAEAPPTCVSVAPRPAATRIVITIGESCHAQPTPHKRLAAAPRPHAHPPAPAHVAPAAPAAPVVNEVAAASPTSTPTSITAKPRPARPAPHRPVVVKPHDPVAASTAAGELVAASVAPSAEGAQYELLLTLLLAMLGAAALWSYGGTHRFRFRRWR